jgi:opacity protein-like surface antigen
MKAVKMKIVVSLVAALALMLVAAPARAADVDGKWTGSLDTPMGAVEVGFNLKADGTTLSGTTTGPDGSEIAIKNGKIEGDKISFLVSIDFGGMALDLNYTGVVKPDQIAFTLDVMGMPFEFAVKKAAK